MNSFLWYNYYDIVIVPPKEVRDYAIQLSKELQKLGSPWVLGNKSYIPHISLYHIPVAPESFDDFAQTVANILQKHSLGELKTTNIEGRLLMFDTPSWIQKLYIDIIKKTVKYFDWDNPFFQNSWPLRKMQFARGVSQKEMRDYLHKYGTPLMGKFFRPHITLGGFMKGAPILPFRNISFRASKLAIYELGPSHSCQKLIKEFRLR